MSSTPENPLKYIIYIALPESISDKAEANHIDPNRRLPVELPDGPNSEALESLSWEMILAAMLKILAYAPDHEDADYYRTFVRTVKPEIVDELTETAVLKAKNSDFDLAEEIFRVLAGLLPDDPVPMLNLALLYEQRSEAEHDESRKERLDEQAFEYYQELLARDDTPPDAVFNAAFFYVRRHSYERARQLFEQYTLESEDDEKKEEAERIIEQIDQQSLDDTLFKEAFDFIRMGREEEGINRVRAFLEHHPDVWNGWFLLGWGERRIGNYSEGRESFEKAIELGGTTPDTLNELSICLMELGELDRSIAVLHEALRLEPENTKVMCNLGIVHLRAEDEEQARRFFESVLAYDPDDPVAGQYLESIKK